MAAGDAYRIEWVNPEECFEEIVEVRRCSHQHLVDAGSLDQESCDRMMVKASQLNTTGYRHLLAREVATGRALASLELNLPSAEGKLHSERYVDLSSYRTGKDAEVLLLFNAAPGEYPLLTAMLLLNAFEFCREIGIEKIFGNCFEERLVMYAKLGFKLLFKTKFDFIARDICLICQDVAEFSSSPSYLKFKERMANAR